MYQIKTIVLKAVRLLRMQPVHRVTTLLSNITILDETNGDTPKYLFRATDVAKALGILNMYRSIQNFVSPKEKLMRKYNTNGGLQDIVFLTSKGVYRLLYISRKPIAEKFRDWVSDILDDIVFNQARKLRVQLEHYIEKNAKLEHHNKELCNTLQKEMLQKEIAFTQCFNKRPVVY